MDGRLRREALRYAGMGRAANGEIDPRIDAFLEKAFGELDRLCRPRFTRKIFALSTSDGSLHFGGALDVTSRSLTVNLRDCEEAVLFAATLGAEADRLIAQYTRRDISQGTLMEAAATAFIEDYCDRCQAELESELNKENKTLRPRFSPGYGDFDIRHQKDMVNLLDLPRSIGVTLTDGGMLTPTKSVTAVMGIAHLAGGGTDAGGAADGLSGPKAQKHRCHVHGCEACMKTDCIYRRNV